MTIEEMEKMGESMTPQEKAKFLGKMYVKGHKAYENDPEARKEIEAINKQIYDFAAKKMNMEHHDWENTASRDTPRGHKL